MNVLRISVVLLSVLSSGSIIFLLYGVYLTPLIFIFTVLLFIFSRKLSIKKTYLLSSFFVVLIMSSYLIFSKIYFLESNSLEYLKLLIRILFMFVLLIYYNIIGIEKLKNDIYFVLKFILFFSLLNFVVINLFNSIFTHQVNANLEIFTIKYIFNYYSSMDIFGIRIFRNQSFFWEPGVLQIFLNLLLLLTLTKYHNSKILFLTIIALISTFSTTGLLIMGLQFFYFFILKKKISTLTILVILPIFTALVYIIYLNIIEKFFGTGVVSSGLRYADFMLSIELLKDNFLFGIGFDINKYQNYQNLNIGYFVDLPPILMENRGNTNSIMSLMVYFGIPFGFFIFVCLYKQTLFEEQKVTFTILFICLSSEPVLLTNFFILLILNGSQSLFKNQKKRILT